MECDECGARMYLLVDGKEMSEEELHYLPRAPKKIEHILNHQLWCTHIRDNFNVTFRQT